MDIHLDMRYVDTVAYEYNTYKVDMNNPSPDDLILILKNEHIASTTFGIKDHPEFTKLRYALHAAKLIKIQTNWINGDTVLRPFSFNGYQLYIGDRFLSSGAWKGRLHTFNNAGLG